MATKKDVKRLLSKGLTGKEAVRLIIQDLVECDHQRTPLLTLPEVKQIRRQVGEGSQQDWEQFNTWLRAYQAISYTLKEAKVLALGIQLSLERQGHIVRDYELFYRLRVHRALSPAIVTQKQYEELKASQREGKLKQLYCLNKVIGYRIGALVAGDKPESPYGRYSDFRNEHLHELKTDEEWEFDEEFGKVYQQAAAEIQELIDSGALEPQVLETRADAPEVREVELDNGGSIDFWPETSYSFPGDISEEEIERQLTSYFTGEQLYQAGLPEWQQEIDAFDTFFCEELFGEGLAVLVESFGWQVDERGYYKPRDLEEISGVPAWEAAAEARGTQSPKALMQSVHRAIRRQIRIYLAWKPVIEAVSELIGVDLAEDIRAGYADIETAVEQYQKLIEYRPIQPLEPEDRHDYGAQELERHPELPAFRIDDLRPDPKEVQHLKERMALALGDEWADVSDEWRREQLRRINEEEARPLGEEVEPCGQDTEE